MLAAGVLTALAMWQLGVTDLIAWLNSVVEK